MSFEYNATINKTTKFSPFKLMFGREGRLPVDFMFEGTDREELKDRSHEDFLKKWGESMEEACQVARENMGKVAEWNKKSYDRKAGAEEISVGDRVLMQNCREKGGTGKLRSYWEESIFEVVEKRADAPVYRIRNIHKEKDERVVHRNLLMQCNQLPEDVFGKSAEKKESRKKKNLRAKKKEVVVESESSDSDEDLDGIFVAVSADAVPEEVIDIASDTERMQEDRGILELENVAEDVVQVEADEAHDPAQAEDNDTDHLESNMPPEDEAERLVEIAEQSENELQEPDETSEDLSESSPSEDSDEEDQPVVRPKSIRKQKPQERLTYDELGGNPVRRAVGPLQKKVQQNQITGYVTVSARMDIVPYVPDVNSV